MVITKKKKSKAQKKISLAEIHFSSQEKKKSATEKKISAQDDLVQGIRKSVKPKQFSDSQTVKNKSKVVFATKMHMASYGAVEVKGFKRLSDAELKEISIIDPYISAIVSKRTSQTTAIGRPSESKFDKGTKLRELIPLALKDFSSREEFEQAKRIRNAQSKAILDWVVHCGTRDEETVNLVYARADSDYKKCNLYQYLQAQTRNLLTFGRCATQIIRDATGIPIMFRPVPVETIFRVLDSDIVHIAHSQDTHPQSLEDAQAYAELNPVARPTAYVQRVDGQDINFFTEDDLVIWNYQSQALFDLNGYPLAPIELAVYMVYVHQQTLTYLRNQFIKGLASKGMIVLESTSPSAQLSEDDIEDFRQQFHNFITRTDNSSAIPVIGGPVKATFIPLNQSPKDIEFLHLEEHIIRALCSSFQVSPFEMGYGHLGLSGQGGMAQSGKQNEVIYGEETGLRNLLDVLYDGLNDIVFSHFQQGKNIFALSYTGVGEDTREQIVQRNMSELNTTATMDSLYADSDRTDPFPFGGAAPLAPHFNQFIVKNMKYWEYRKYFFSDAEAENNPAYDFIIDPNMNQVYQQLKVTPVQQQQAQSQMEFALTAQQAQQPQQQEQAPAEQQQEPEQKSENLKEVYRRNGKQVETMNKSSYESLFEDWIKVNLAS